MFKKNRPSFKGRSLSGVARNQETTYEFDYSAEMPQSIAFAYWANVSKEDIRNLIWTPNQWSAYIKSSPQSYNKDGQWRKAFELYTKLEDINRNYIPCDDTSGPNAGAFRYFDALEIFKDLTINKDTFDSGTENASNRREQRLSKISYNNCMFINYNSSRCNHNKKQNIKNKYERSLKCQRETE